MSLREKVLALEWRPVVGHETRYEVCDIGVVRSLKSGNVVKGYKGAKGYVVICLCNSGAVERRFAHAIVAGSFIGPRPAGMHVDHIDGNRSNNSAANLRYVTPKGNIAATIARGAHAYGSKNGQAKLSEEQVALIRKAKETRGRYWGALDFAKQFGVTRCQIQRAARGQTFRHVAACAAAIRKSVE